MHRNFIRSLPLVAEALGRKYGLKVVIGGEQAATDGDTIYLPSLPLDSPPELVALARSFIDHEAAHVRSTNIRTVKKANLTPLEKHIWNTLEDWRVEKVLGDIFPGCRQNFEWLIRHMFDKEPEENTPLDLDILNWLLLEVRSWTVPDLEPRVKCLESRVDKALPGLIGQIKRVLDRVKTSCPDTKAAINYALEIVEILKQWVTMPPKQPQEVANKAADSSDCQGGPESQPSEPTDADNLIQSLMARSGDELPQGLGESVGKLLDESKDTSGNSGLKVATISPKEFDELEPFMLDAVKCVTTGLKFKLQNLLQAMTIKKIRPGYQGRLDTKIIYKLFLADPRIFRKSGIRVGLNTAIHLLIDVSGSMNSSISLVSQASYALCRALHETPGISVAASAFPGKPVKKRKSREKLWETVAPILNHGQRMHREFYLEAQGSTPMGEAIWWALREMSHLRESRKIIIILTDGEPDSVDNTKAAIAESDSLGLEIYGLGLGGTSIKELLPGRSVEVDCLSELPRKMFELLGQAMNRAA